MSDEFWRKFCLEWHAKSVREGYFLVARYMLRKALKFRRGCRGKSRAYGYLWFNCKLASYQWGN